MKANATRELESALGKYQNAEAGLARDKKFLSDSGAELYTLERQIDFSDRGAVARLTALLTISQVGPTRQVARRQELEAAQKALVDGCDQFSRTVLAPRCQQLESRALAKVEGKVKQLFPDKEALRVAAFHSTELAELAPIQEKARRVASEYSEVIPRHAKLLLDAWSAADAFEAKHLG